MNRADVPLCRIYPEEGMQGKETILVAPNNATV